VLSLELALTNAIDLDGHWRAWNEAAFNAEVGSYGCAPNCSEIVCPERVFSANGLSLRKLAVGQVKPFFRAS